MAAITTEYGNIAYKFAKISHRNLILVSNLIFLVKESANAHGKSISLLWSDTLIDCIFKTMLSHILTK